MIGKKVLNKLSAYKQGMQIDEVKKAYQLDHIVKLASNENPYGYSKLVGETIVKMDEDFELYPDGYAYELRIKLTAKLGVEKDQLIIGAGSDEIVTMICRAFLQEHTNTVMAASTFPQYRHHALIEGANVKEIPTMDGKHDLVKMAAAIDASTKVVWLCMPDNPTGSVITQEQLDDFMFKCPQDVVVVLDLAYIEYVDDVYQIDHQTNLNNYPNLIMLRTFSKIYGIAGLRVGYGIANETLAEKLNVVRGPFNTSSLAQRVATRILDDEGFISETKQKNKQVRTQFEQFLDRIGWGYYPSETNFLLVKTPIDADEVTGYLLKYGFIVRSGNMLGYPNTIRCTIGKQEDMLTLQTVIQKLDKTIRNGVMR